MSAEALGTPWLVAAALLCTGMAVTFAIRIDPVHIGRRLAAGGQNAQGPDGLPARPLLQLLQLPLVLPALTAGVVAQGVMAALMSVTGLIMVGNGHELPSIALVMSAHFLGMYGLVLVVGQLVDRLGRQVSIVAGLPVLALGVLLLLTGPGLGAVIAALFTIGLGWNVAFVGATAVLADAGRPAERARLLGFHDFAAIIMGAIGAAVCAAILGAAGLVPLVLIGMVLALLPIAGMLPRKAASAQPRP